MIRYRTIRETMRRRVGARGIGAIVAAAAICVTAGGSLHAQWEQTFGSPTCDESGNKGIAPVTVAGGGGYIMAGVTHNTGAGCPNSNIYVARISTFPGAAPLWANSYHIGVGGNDAARCVAECANGDFIVTGVADNLGGGCNTNELFLMRLNPVGGIVWVKTYGTAGIEAGNYVFEAKTGNGVTTNPGDIVACGFSTNAAGVDVGYIIRTTSAGVLIWDQTYSGAAGVVPGNRRFLSVAECTNGIPVLGVGGDIVAAGWANTPAGAMQGLLVRVNGNTGAIGAPPQNAALFGGPATEKFNDVQEMQIGANAGNLIVAGTSAGEIYMMKIGADPCTPPIVQTKIGDGLAATPDEALCVRELPVGNLIVTGVSSVAGGHGGTDAFFAELTPAALAIIASPPGAGFKLFGGAGNDEGHSCARVPLGAGGVPAQGYIVAGHTQSAALMAAGDVGQAYVFKTDMLGATGCELAPAPVIAWPGFLPICFLPVMAPITATCNPGCVWAPLPGQTVPCPIVGPVNRRGEGGNDGIAGVGTESPAEMLDGSGVTSYPNPVRKGETITFNYPATGSADVAITVSDISGAVIARASAHVDAGAARIPVSTRGWAAGSYVVTLDSGRESVSRKIVVMER